MLVYLFPIFALLCEHGGTPLAIGAMGIRATVLH